MFTTPITLLTSAAHAASGLGDPVLLAEKTTVAVTLEVTAASGTSPTLLVTIETSPDGVNAWVPVGSFTTLTAANVKTQTFPGCQGYVRARYAVSAGASFTFSLKGFAVLVYATPQDLRDLALPAEALSGISDALIDVALQAATSEADDYLGTSFNLPLKAWGTGLRAKVCERAAYSLMVRRGFNPNDGADQIIVERGKEAADWLKGVAAEKIFPSAIVDSTPTVSDTQATIEIYCDEQRGY